MNIITAYFARKKSYVNLLTVFQNSLKDKMPGVKLRVIKMSLPPNVDHKRDTAYAFIAAAERAINHQRGVLAVADCDLMFLRSITNIEKYNFDIAITVRDKKSKYNTGLWFMRSTEAGKKFIERWIENTKKLMRDFCNNEGYVHEWAGIDQASLHMTIEENIKGITILELPCVEWNATQSEWSGIDEDTRVIHIKSALRRYCCNPDKEIPEGLEYLKPYIEKWRSYL